MPRAHWQISLVIIIMISLVLLLQISLFAPIAVADQEHSLLRLRQRLLQFDEESSAVVQLSGSSCAPEEVTKDGSNKCQRQANATDITETAKIGNNSSSSEADTCLDFSLLETNNLTVDWGVDMKRNCFNLTVFGWGKELGPWDPWAGYVCVDMPQSEVLEISYQAETYWRIWETALWIGQNLSTMPQTNISRTGTGTTTTTTREPNLEKFPYRDTGLNGTENFTYTALLNSQLACEQASNYTIHVAAYAFVAEPIGVDPAEYIWATEYPAWGQNINNMSSTESTDADASFLYFDLPISCSCSREQVERM